MEDPQAVASSERTPSRSASLDHLVFLLEQMDNEIRELKGWKDFAQGEIIRQESVNRDVESLKGWADDAKQRIASMNTKMLILGSFALLFGGALAAQAVTMIFN